MNSQTQVLDDIFTLKQTYHYDNNLFKFKKTVSEEEFTVKMKYFIDNYKTNIKDLKIIDIKNYHDYKTVLKIYDNGKMEAYINKKLKYIKYKNNSMLELYNKRTIDINQINFKQKYDRIFKKKKIIIKDIYEHIIEFIVSMEEKDTKNDNKSKMFYINVINNSGNINNKMQILIDLLNKND